MNKRLVSAVYNDYRPFNMYDDIFTSFYTTVKPDDLKEDDVLVIWGGGDISPSFYGHKRHNFGSGMEEPTKRDVWEWNLLQRSKELGIPIIGICRGAQMLCAAEGGYLIQDTDGHAGQNHTVLWYDGDTTIVNSLHHQMMVPDGDYQLIAKTPKPLSSVYHAMTNEGKPTFFDSMLEPEFIYYPNIKGFAIQWHPEMMGHSEKATGKIMSFIKEKLHD